MPNLALIQSDSLVPSESVVVGSGLAGGNEVIDSVNHELGAVGQLVQQHKAVAMRQQLDEANVGITNAVSQEHMTSLQAATDAANSGQMPGFVKQWQQDFDARVQSGADSVSTLPQAQTEYQRRMAELKGQLSTQFYGAEMGARNAKLNQDSKAGTDVDASTAFIDRSQAPNLLAKRLATIDSLALPDEEKAQLSAQAKQKISYAAGSNYAQNDPDGFLKSLGVGAQDPAAAAQARQADPVLSQLAPQNLEQLVDHAKSLIARRDAANAAAKDQAEAVGAKTYNGLLDFVAGGQVPSLPYATEVAQGTKGTSFEVLAQDKLKQAYAGAGFGAQSLPRQQALLTGYEAYGNANGSDPDTQKAMDQMRTIHSTQVAAYADNPWDAAARFAHAPAQPVQQITSVAQGLQLAQQRAAALPAVEVASGAPQSPFQPSEAAQLGALVHALPIDQAASALASIGAAAGTSDRVAAIAKQFHDTDGTLGMAMAYAGNHTNTGRLVGDLILRGDQALKDKTAAVAEGTAVFAGWKQEIANEIRGAYSDHNVEDDAVKAAFLIAAARSSLGQSDDIGAAVALATGGIIQHGTAGAKIPLPWGMKDDGTFDRRIAALKPADLAAQVPDGVVHIGNATLPLDKFVASLPDATLVHAGQGMYNVRGGTQLATNSQGQRIVIKIAP